MIWILVGYMWLFIHRPFEVWPFLGTLRVERVYMILTLIAWAMFSAKQLNGNKIHFAVALLAFAVTLSTIMSPYINILNGEGPIDWYKFLIFYFLVVTSVKTEKDLQILCTAFVVCFFLYMLHSYREFLCGRGYFALGVFRMIGIDKTLNDPNHFSNTIVCLFPFLFPLLTILKKRWHYLFILAYLLLSIRCVQLTGSRTGFMVFGIGLFTAAALSKYRMKIIPIMLLMAPMAFLTMDESQQNRIRSVWDPTVSRSGNDSAEGRLHGLYMGIENWKKSPVWGVGPGAHGAATGEGFQAHFLYGQIPSELGTLGVVAFLALIVGFGVNHFQIWKCYKELQQQGREKEGLYCYRLSYGICFAIFMMLLFGFGVHNAFRYNWIWWAAFQSVATSMMQEKVVNVFSTSKFANATI